MSIFGRVVYRQSLNNRGDSTVESKSDLPNFYQSDTLYKSSLGGTTKLTAR